MCFYEFLGDGKSQSSALKFLRTFSINAKESIEDKWKLVFGNPWPIVFDAYANKTILFVKFNLYEQISPGPVLDGVADDVVESLMESLPVQIHPTVMFQPDNIV